MGKNELVENVTQKIVQKIEMDKTIYECYLRDGKPLKRFIYTAENPFAWASGMITWALLEE